MGYPCIYQKFPIPWDDTSKFPRPSHKNQMIWSQYHTIPWDGIDPPYPRPYHTFPTRNTTSWEQTPLHYGEACLPAMLASQPASNSPLEYTSHHTPNINIRIQSTLEHSSPISISNTHLSRRNHYSLIT